MAVLDEAISVRRGLCLSSDTKPTDWPDGSRLTEYDTGAEYVSVAGGWCNLGVEQRNLKRASISVAASSGDTQVVAAVTGKKIRLVSAAFVSDTAVTIKFRDNTGTPIDLTGGMPVAQYGGAMLRSERMIGETGVGKALMINTSIAATVGGFVEYEEV